MNRTCLLWLALSLGCTAERRIRPPESDPPLRHALGVRAPRELHEVDGVSLAVHDSDPSGSKPALICLHAIGHGGNDFAGLEDAFGARYRIITVDWPGHGFSGTDPQPASAIRYATLLSDLVDRLHLEKAVVLGNSIGGAAAVRFAAAHPEHVRALILANPGGFDPGASGVLGRWYIGTLIDHFEQGVRDEARFAGWFRDYYDGILITPAAAQEKTAIIAAGYESAPVLAQAWESFRRPEASLIELSKTLTVPVLVTWATQDKIVAWDRNRANIEAIPQVKVEQFEAGHAAFLEAPDAFNRSLDAFLTALPRAP